MIAADRDLPDINQGSRIDRKDKIDAVSGFVDISNCVDIGKRVPMIGKFAFNRRSRCHQIRLREGFLGGHRDQVEKIACGETSPSFDIDAADRKLAPLAQREGDEDILLVLTDGHI